METRLQCSKRVKQPVSLPLEIVRHILAHNAHTLFQMGDHALCKFLLKQELVTHLQCHLGWACSTGRYALVRLMLRHGAFMDHAALLASCCHRGTHVLQHIAQTHHLPQQYLHAAITCCISSGSVHGLRHLVGRLTAPYHVRSAEPARIVMGSSDLSFLLVNGIIPGDTWMMYWTIVLDSASALEALLTCSLEHLDLDAAFVVACIMGRLHIAKRLRELGASIGSHPDIASQCQDPDTLAYLIEEGLIDREGLDRSLIAALDSGRLEIALRICVLGANTDCAVGACIRRGDTKTCMLLKTC